MKPKRITKTSGCEVFDALRQRPPFLFVDAIAPDSPRAGALVHFTFPKEAPYFAGHFPENPVVPGVLLVEAMAQAARCALYLHLGTAVTGYLVRVDGCRFQQLVRPGQGLTISAKLEDSQGLSSWRGRKARMADARCSVFGGGKRVARARITLHLEAFSVSRSEVSDEYIKSRGEE